MIDTAVVLAAGNGTRLREVSHGLPKPLVGIAGVPIIIRVLRAAQEAGVHRFVIVTGYRADRLREEIDGHPAISAGITWVHNPEYATRSNGTSALAAEPSVRGPFALLMGDHIFDVNVLRRLLRTPINPGECVLAVDRKIDRVFDLDDATKVVDADGKLEAIGKGLSHYGAIDTGMFLCTPAVFDALRAVEHEGDGNLSDAIRWLARDGRMRTFDVGEALWQDVDTPEMRREAERRLGTSLCKPTDGPISRLLNRRISIPISLMLARTGITPNQISAFNLILGVVGGLLFATTSYPVLVLAGILVQLASILDGCDGEVARLTFRQSLRGAWIDTVIDHVSSVALLLGLVIGQFRREPTAATLWLGSIALIAAVAGLLIAYRHAHSLGRGSLHNFIPDRRLVDPATGRVFWVYEQLYGLIRHENILLGCFVLALANLPTVIYGLWVVGSVMFMIGVMHITSVPVQRQDALAMVVDGEKDV